MAFRMPPLACCMQWLLSLCRAMARCLLDANSHAVPLWRAKTHAYRRRPRDVVNKTGGRQGSQVSNTSHCRAFSAPVHTAIPYIPKHTYARSGNVLKLRARQQRQPSTGAAMLRAVTRGGMPCAADAAGLRYTPRSAAWQPPFSKTLSRPAATMPYALALVDGHFCRGRRSTAVLFAFVSINDERFILAHALCTARWTRRHCLAAFCHGVWRATCLP